MDNHSRVAIVTSHVIQYQDPLFRLLGAEPSIDLTVFFCSTHGATTFHDEDMKTSLRWDIELLEGYRHQFLRNVSPLDISRGFWRLVNPGIITALARGGFDLVIFMMGWGSATAWLGFAVCTMLRIPFFLYGDSSFPPPARGLRGAVRDRILRALFRAASGFMVSGKLNADYYRHYGADPSTFFLLPWAVDNARFEAGSRMDPEERRLLRESHGIADDDLALVFSAKLVARKDPMTLLRAVERLEERRRIVVVFLGDGELRPELEAFSRKHGLRTKFLGFVNQTTLPKLYAMGDLFILPSLYEPRGAVINEAMACGLPVIVTDRCGSIGDIVLDGENALIYPAGDAEALGEKIRLLLTRPQLREKMARRSREIIAHWGYPEGVEGIRKAAEWIATRRGSSQR